MVPRSQWAAAYGLKGCASFLWMSSRSEAISMGFTRTSSACKRIADKASSSAG